MKGQKVTEESKRYRQENDYYCVDIFLKNILQLFDRRDPSPFKEKDLDEDFSRYLILAVREIGENKKIKLVIKMPDHQPTYLKARDVEEAIVNFFAFEEENFRNDLSVLFKQGRSTLTVGLIFLASCYTAYYFLKEDPTLWSGVLSESLTVVGWVAMWRPINIFLYDWLPIWDRINLMRQIQKIKVEIITD